MHTHAAAADPSASSPGYINDKAALRIRLRRIEGQVRGLQRQVDEDAYCMEILTQVSAVTKALQSVALLLLEDHLEHCMSPPATPEERQQHVAEATNAISRLVRS
ncbi:MAG: metal-sensitive transcriptional regulator [Nocardioides sp.]|nr:metal-sensitive transcriptional regulator [Nocardioides sp.]